VLGRPTLEPGVSGAEANPTPASPPTTARRRRSAKDSGGDGAVTPLTVLMVLLVGVLGTLIFLRRRAVMERRAGRLGARRTIADARRRGTIDAVEAEQVASSGHVRILDPRESRRRRTHNR
jgi:hypothetical protein